MASNSKIEWTDSSWNVVTGCTPIAVGCKNCYAARMAKRLKAMGQHKYRNEFQVTCQSECLDEPLRWKKPRRVFVVSMGDLFHKNVPDEFICRVWETMERAKQHTFLVLTKRPQRMVDVLGGTSGAGLQAPPLRNVHVGFSASTQADFDAGREHLLRTPAAVRWVSLEPLVEPIDCGRIGLWMECSRCSWAGCEAETRRHVFYATYDWWSCLKCGAPCKHTPPLDRGFVGGAPTPHINWVVVGGESGPGARPMDPDWVRSIRDDCIKAGVPFFFKGFGAWMPKTYVGKQLPPLLADCHKPRGHDWGNGQASYRVGKKKAGRELDGRTWDELPAPVASGKKGIDILGSPKEIDG